VSISRLNTAIFEAYRINRIRTVLSHGINVHGTCSHCYQYYYHVSHSFVNATRDIDIAIQDYSMSHSW